MKNTRGDVGIGTLVLFIALVVVAAIAAGVMLQTGQSISGSVFSTGTEAKSQISTGVIALGLIATGDGDATLTDFCMSVKLAPNSDPIKLSDSIITFNTQNEDATLAYRGINSRCIEDNVIGFNTFQNEELGQLRLYDGGLFSGSYLLSYLSPGANLRLDLDGDGINDTVRTCHPSIATGPCPFPYNGTHLQFNLTQDGLLYVPLTNDNGSLAILTTGTAAKFNITHQDIGSYGYLTGTRDSAGSIGRIFSNDPNIHFAIYVNPTVLNNDLDADGADDLVGVNRTHAVFFLSSLSHILSVPLGLSLTGANNLNVATQIRDGTDVYGDVVIQGLTTAPWQIDESVTFRIEPANVGEGFYSVEYEKTGARHIEGSIVDGDIVKMCFESPAIIPEENIGTIGFLPRTGQRLEIDYLTPVVINDQVVTLFP